MAVLKKRKTDIDQIRESAKSTSANNVSFSPNKGNLDLTISTGSTLLDLAISGNRRKEGGVPGGILIEIYGQSGSGKCVVGNSFIFANQKLSPISFFSKNKKGFIPKKITLATKEGEFLSSAFYEEEVSVTYKIKNNLAMELQGTSEHPIYVLNPDCSFSFKKLKNIKQGDICCVLRKLNIFPKKELKIQLNYKQIKKTNALLLKIPKTLTIDIARLLGYIIANGTGKKGGKLSPIGFSSKNKQLIEDFYNIVKNLGITKPPYSYNNKDYSFGGIWLQKFILFLLNEEQMPTARYKKVPDCILNSPKEHQLNFLQGLFDCDSSLCGSVLQYSTASEILANQIQMMLLNIGIISTKRSKFLNEQNHTYWTIDINGNDVNLFFNLIKSIKYAYFKPKNHSACRDRIPYLKKVILDKIKFIKQKYNWKSNGMIYYKGKHYRFTIGDIVYLHKSDFITYSYLFSLIEKMKNLSFIPEIKELLDFCLEFKDKNYFFSKIISNRKIIKPVIVYDFTIPIQSNFFSNGYISHNTAILSEMCGSTQKRGGEVKFADPEARLDQEYSQIYGVNIKEDFFDYSRPDTVSDIFNLIWDWQPKNDKVINIFAGDSIAALSTEMEMEDRDKMGMRRAKEFSAGLRKTCRIIKNNNWIIAFTNQLRQDQSGYITPGGLGIPFYSSLRIQVTPMFKGNKIKKKIKLPSGTEIEKTIGINSLCTITKSSIDEPFKTAPICIIFNYGIDDIRANLQYYKDMTKETKYNAITKEFLSMESAIRCIEENKLELELRERIIDLWNNIQKQFDVSRKPKER